MSTDTTSTSSTTGTGTGLVADPGTTQRVHVAVAADRDRVWSALTDAATTPAYYFGFAAEYGDLAPGSAYRYTAGGGDVITGTLLDVEPGRRLRMTFRGAWAPDVAELPESVVTFTLEDPPVPTPGVTLLGCVHEGLPDTPAARQLESGWVTILSGLKTLLETGRPMAAPPA